jgi:hypothetical protein
MGGQSDSKIGDIVCAEKRALITLDLDFADIRSYPPEQYAGLIVLRLSNLVADRSSAAADGAVGWDRLAAAAAGGGRALRQLRI